MSKMISIPGYKVLEKLGSGSYSTVYKAWSLESPQQHVAIKCIEKANLSSRGRDNIINEIKIMKLLQHDFVVKFIDFQWDERYVYLVLEYCNVGDLSSFIKRKRRLPEQVFFKFIQQLALGLKFLRSHNVSHFDLKPQNLLLTKCPKLTLKIADFGFAQFLSRDSLKTSIRGSPIYMAPEMILKQQYSPKADLWSVGIISYQCLFGAPPICASNICDIIKSHKKEAPIVIPPKVVSLDCCDLLSRLLVYDPSLRIDFDEFFKHPFLDLMHYPTEESYPKAVKLVHEAVKLDYEKQYKESFKKYCSALQYLVPYVKDLENCKRKDMLNSKILEYTNRAEELKNYISKDLSEITQPNSGVNRSPHNSPTPLQQGISLATLCRTTPCLVTAIEMARVGCMYLAEDKYIEALESFKSAIGVALPAVQSEPPGIRKDLLRKQIKEWLTAAENVKILISIKKINKTDEHLLECHDGCSIQ